MGTPSALASRLAAPYFASAIPRRSQFQTVFSVTPTMTASRYWERPASLRSRAIAFRVAIARNLFPVVAFNPLLTAVQSKRPVNRRKGAISLKAVLRTRAAVK